MPCLQAIKYLERMLIQAQKQKKEGILIEKPEDDEENFDADKEINVDPKTYCKLGHFHLLLDDYEKGAMSISSSNYSPMKIF